MNLTKLLISKTAVNTYIIFFGNGLSAFLAFIFTVLYARILTISDVGYFAALVSMLLLVSDLGDMGIGMSLSTFIPPLEEAKQKLMNFLKTAFFLQLIIASILTIPLLIYSGDISNLLFHSGELSFFVTIISVGIFFLIFSNFIQYALSSQQKFLKSSILVSSGGLFRLGLFFILIWLSQVTLKNLVYIQTISLFILLIFSLFLFKFDIFKGIYRVNRKDFFKLFNFTLLIGIARGLTAIASKLDVLMIISLKSPAEAGVYSLASRVIAIYPLLTGSFNTVIAPKIAKTTEKRYLTGYLLKIIIATLALIATILVLILMAKPFMMALFAEKGILATGVFQLLLLSMIFFVGSIPAVSIAVYFLKKPQVLTVNSILQVVIVILGNLILIPKFGSQGAAYSLIAAYGGTLFTTILLTVYYYKKHN